VNFAQGFSGFAPPLYGYVSGAYDLLRQRNLLQTPLLFSGQPIIFDAKAVAQVNFPDKQGIFSGFGLEATVNGVIIGRIGYQTGSDNRAGLSVGAGVNVGQFRLEYSFRNYHNAGAGLFTNDPLGDSHNVSFTYFWGGPQQNLPVVPVVVTQPVDTAALNEAVRRAIQEELNRMRPLLDSLRQSRVEIVREGEVSRYIVPVYFGFDSADIRGEDTTVLRQVGDVIRRAYPTALVTIEGFADPAGTQDYNVALSKRRADAVKAYMVQLGLPAAQFRTVGYGKQPVRQVTPGATRDQPGAVLNRRVTFTIDATQHF
jgi:outer membrane protein OmpA-like peptidoglycan-associated protein